MEGLFNVVCEALKNIGVSMSLIRDRKSQEVELRRKNPGRNWDDINEQYQGSWNKLLEPEKSEAFLCECGLIIKMNIWPGHIAPIFSIYNEIEDIFVTVGDFCPCGTDLIDLYLRREDEKKSKNATQTSDVF